VLAGIGELPETVRDRAIVITMTRKAPGDPVERLRARDAARLGHPIGAALARALENVRDLTIDDEDLPDELDGRAQDGREPTIAPASRSPAAGWRNCSGRSASDRRRIALVAGIAGVSSSTPGPVTSPGNPPQVPQPPPTRAHPWHLRRLWRKSGGKLPTTTHPG